MDQSDLLLLPQFVRKFRPRCPGCTLGRAASIDARPCSFYDCPGLPAELEVTCDKCMFDFVADDGQPACDHDVCETALRLKSNVPTYLAWIEILRAEQHPATQSGV